MTAVRVNQNSELKLTDIENSRFNECVLSYLPGYIKFCRIEVLLSINFTSISFVVYIYIHLFKGLVWNKEKSPKSGYEIKQIKVANSMVNVGR